MNILIKNAYIITMNEKEEIFENADLAIENDRIKYVNDVPSDFKADKIIDGSKKAVLPGLINAHTHMAMSLFRNYADDLPLHEWLTQKIWPIEDKLTGEDVYYGTMLSIVESIKSGVTCFSDMYFFMDDTAKAALESGIRARLAWGMIGSRADDDSRFDITKRFYSDWQGKGDGRITIMAGPHAPYTCSPEYLKRVADFVKEMSLSVHIHLSESKREVEENYEKYGKSPIKHVYDIGIFDVPVTAAHCVHLSDEDIDILKEKNVSVVYNPGSNLKLGNGFAPVVKLLEKGVNVALGTDGSSSNNNVNMFEEINLAAILNKGVTGNPTVVPAIEALKMATINGAKALCMDKDLGSIEVDKKADIIIVDMNKPHFYPIHDVVSSMAYTAQGSDVETVIINGNIVMENYEIKTVDVEKLYYNVERCINRLIG
ncbi:5-methylthioadenosine/S-adenosylhomocysteine deaminase [Caloramator quimbayensis]|uniref:5-methylthioadenosine/S-adenosylhomocysteine deaminase n=1 Tax=Caloramator quimbayensis TaxID=1147123 RepID=A0A1T4WJL0_9CLOT|nr:amidohydrolase [Caloramator quimbayensis]SKA77512.1 5-methylthioadenosine/S-adenosylhomocysteine deaminase [Caloramator quimbayensis]